MKSNFQFSKVLLTVLLLFLLLNCKKDNPKTLPVVTTSSSSSVTNITGNSATVTGEISSDGGESISARGYCWSSTNNTPTTTDTKSSDGTGSGKFTSTLTGLMPGTTYYLRSYATNSIGTVYGNAFSFKTAAILPTVTTTSASSITNVTSNSAKVGGEVTADGGDPVTARGYCWSSTNTTPTISDNKSADGTGSGVFTSSLTGLLFGTTYNIRSYATNSVGTVYGNTVSFTTIVILPTITTTDITSITTSSATTGGNITADGGGSINARGVCWNTSSGPTISNNKTLDGIGKGSFKSTLSNLMVNTTYYLRAYATNSAGTTYGNEITATTLNQNIKNIVSDDLLKTISNLGMPIFNGKTPPNLVNFYKMSPIILKNTNVPGDSIGYRFNDANIHFYNQDNTNLTVKLDTKQGSSTSSSYGAFISGSGNDFSAFIKVISLDSDGKQADVIEIYSGTMTSSGIKNLYLAAFMVNNYGNTEYIPNGNGRVFYDSDGMSPIVLSLSSQVFNNQKSAKIGSHKNMLEK